MPVQQVPHAAEKGVPLFRRRGDHVAARRDHVEQDRFGDAVRPFDVEPLNRGERRSHLRARAISPLLGALVDDPPELGHPVLPFVADVPYQPERATRRQDPRHLGHGPLRIDPVPRLAHDHRVHRPVVQRDLLGRPGQRARARQDPAQLLPHAVGRLDRHHIEAAVHQQPGQLAGARPQIEDTPRPRPAAASRAPRPGTAAARARTERLRPRTSEHEQYPQIDWSYH
jgi:hypothetical protein